MSEAIEDLRELSGEEPKEEDIVEEEKKEEPSESLKTSIFALKSYLKQFLSIIPDSDIRMMKKFSAMLKGGENLDWDSLMKDLPILLDKVILKIESSTRANDVTMIEKNAVEMIASETDRANKAEQKAAEFLKSNKELIRSCEKKDEEISSLALDLKETVKGRIKDLKEDPVRKSVEAMLGTVLKNVKFQEQSMNMANKVSFNKVESNVNQLEDSEDNEDSEETVGVDLNDEFDAP